MTLNYVARNVQELGKEEDVEILVTDWGSDIPLREVIELSTAAAKIISFILIPPEIAHDLQKDSPFPEVLALNVAVRRAKGEYIGRIDQDTLVGKHFLNTFFEIYKKPRLLIPLDSALLLSNRRRIPYRFTVRCPSFWAVDRFIHWFGQFLPLMDPPPPHLYYQSYIGIWLLHRNLWYDCGGYDEQFIYMDNQEKDMVLRLTPKYTFVNLGELVNHDFYHLDHCHPRDSWGANRNRKTNPVRDLDNRPEEFYPNSENWGLIKYPLEALHYSPNQGDIKKRTPNHPRSNWLAFTVQLLTTGVQILWDGLIVSLRTALIALLRFLLSFSPVWQQRARIAWETARGQPLTSWPRLFKKLWIERKSRKRS